MASYAATAVVSWLNTIPAVEENSITHLLADLASGDKRALDQLVPLVYAELRRIAGGQMRNEADAHTLQPTALVHEAYARLIKQDQPDYRNRAHFLAVAAQVMRQILIDHARKRGAARRGKRRPEPLDEAHEAAVEQSSMMIDLNDALEELARRDALKARLIEMRFFGGLTAEDSAEVLGIPVTTVRSQLRIAQAWLEKELGKSAAAGV